MDRAQSAQSSGLHAAVLRLLGDKHPWPHRAQSPLHPEHPSGTDPGCPAVAFLVTAWAGRWQALGETFRGRVEHAAEEVFFFFKEFAKGILWRSSG